jgi:hypothetical protein
MKPVFITSSPNDALKIAQFLVKAFSTGPDDMIARPDLMHWKYWAERADWSGSRSFRLERDGGIVARPGHRLSVLPRALCSAARRCSIGPPIPPLPAPGWR